MNGLFIVTQKAYKVVNLNFAISLFYTQDHDLKKIKNFDLKFDQKTLGSLGPLTSSLKTNQSFPHFKSQKWVPISLSHLVEL